MFSFENQEGRLPNPLPGPRNAQDLSRHNLNQWVRLSVAALFCACLMLTFAGSAKAQSGQGVVTGAITDVTGAVVPNAQLTLTNEGTNVSQKEQSRSDGSYRFGLVPPGVYTLKTEAPGFTTKDVKSIVVDASSTVPVAVVLSVATSQTVVEVTAQDAIVQTATSDLSTSINQKFIENMPLLTRNVFDLAFAAPSVTQGMNFGPASGGARESGTNFILNGADNNDNFSEGNPNISPPLESVREFTVLTNSMSAEYGHAAGALVSAVQKSGTNGFHGAVYEFNRNRTLNASDFFSNQQGYDPVTLQPLAPKPKYIRNQFGGEVDGPIIKNRTFFSFAYDRYDLRQGATFSQAVPTASELSAMGTGTLAQKYISSFNPITSESPCPLEAQNYPGALGHVGCIQKYDPQNTVQNVYVGRVDHNFNAKDRISFTANISRFNYTDLYGGGDATTAKPISYVDDEHYHNLNLNETHVFNSTMVNELTVAHNRHYSDTHQTNAPAGVARVIIDGSSWGGLGFGYGGYEGYPNSFTQDRWQFQDNFSWTLGKHSIKVGGGFQYGQLYRNWDLGNPGYYEFANTTGPTPQSVGALNPDGTIGGIANSNDSNFQHDFPYYSELSINPATGAKADAYRHYIMKDSNIFVNDSWKFSRRLTLNLGLRWERYGSPTEARGILAQFINLTGTSPAEIAAARTGPVSSFWKTPNKDFGPRVGFAYDVFGDGRTAVRGGYGISYDRLFDNIWSNGAWNPPFYALLDHDATASDSISYTVPPSNVGTTLPRVSVRTMDVHMKDSSVQNYYLGVEHQFGRDILLRVNYQGSQGRHLSQLMNLNRYDGMEYQTVNLSSTNPGRPNSLYSGFNYRANNLNSGYNAMTNEVQKRFSNGLQMQFSYTWSKLMDQGSDLFSGSTTTGQYSQPFYFISNSAPQLEKAPGAFDHTHNFKAIFTYELPFFKSQHGFAGRALGGWQISSFYQGYSGHPIDVYSSRGRFLGSAGVFDANGRRENIGGDYNLDGVANDRPNFIGSSVQAAYSGFSPADGIFVDNNLIGCGYAGSNSTAARIAACNANYGVSTPNSLFVNPPGVGPRYGQLGRNVFRGPWFNGWDASLLKNFKVTEAVRLQLRFEALNVDNHPNFDGIISNLNSGSFGKAQILVGQAHARILQIGGRITF